MTTETFKRKVAETDDECEIDALCIRWLSELTSDYGREGRHAKELLRIVQDLLEIGSC